MKDKEKQIEEKLMELRLDKQELMNEISEKNNKIALLEETIECIKFNIDFTRKETAEKILKEILFVECTEGWQENKQLVEFGNRIVNKIEELAKQFGIEIKE